MAGKRITLKSALAVIALVSAPLTTVAEEIAAPVWGDVSAIFQERCVMCHSAVSGATKGLRLDDYAALMRGSAQGVVLKKGDPKASILIRRLRGEIAPRMPFLSRALSEDQIALIERWIEMGMPESRGWVSP